MTVISRRLPKIPAVAETTGGGPGPAVAGFTHDGATCNKSAALAANVMGSEVARTVAVWNNMRKFGKTNSLDQ